MTKEELVQHYSNRKQKLIDKLNAGEFIQSDWVDFINDARLDGMPSMANDMTQRYVHYLKRRLNGDF